MSRRDSLDSNSSSSSHGGTRIGSGRKRNKNDESSPPSPSNIEMRNNLRINTKMTREKQISYCENLQNSRGRQYTKDQCRLLLRILYGDILINDETVYGSIMKLSAISGAGDKTLRMLFNYWEEHEEVPSPQGSPRGGGSPTHFLHDSRIDLDAEVTIHRIISTLNREEGKCRTSDICKALLDEHQVNISENGLAKRLHALGYQYGKSVSIGGMSIAARKARCVLFLREYSLAIEEESRGEAIICYMDESYVHERHRSNYTWFSLLTQEGNEVGGETGKGKRLMLVHAITKDGLLGDYHDDEDLGKVVPSSQHFFVGGYIGKDYHKNMNDELFISWLNHRFIPAFDAKYPNKKCILVLDNARYHHARGDEYVRTSGISKKEMITHLATIGVNSITILRNGAPMVFNADSFSRPKSCTSPSADELLSVLKLKVLENPSLQWSHVRHIFEERKWQLIYTPPYTPVVQPIELVWAYTKNFVASEYQTGRTLHQLQDDVKRAFYGDLDLEHTGVTAQMCTKMIDNSRKWCNNFINKNIKEDGNLHSLAINLSQESPDEPSADIETDMWGEELMEAIVSEDNNEEET